jgi:hypothetical protein
MTLATGKNVPILNGYAPGENGWAANMNLALRLIESMCLPVAINFTTATPPTTPAEGDLYVIAPSGTGVWLGKDGYIARWSVAVAAWDIIAPKSGWRIWSQATSNWFVYTGTSWVNDSAWLSGSGVPAGSLGNVSNFYVDSATGNFYQKTAATTWTLQGSLKGTPGTNGNTILTTSGAPTAATGNNGDYAIDTSAQLIYYKSAGTWNAGTNMKGATGNSLSRPTSTITSASGAVTIPLASGNEVYLLTLSENITSWSFTGLPASGFTAEIRVEITQSASTAYTCDSPASAGNSAGELWKNSMALGAIESLGIAVDNAGTKTVFASGVYV